MEIDPQELTAAVRLKASWMLVEVEVGRIPIGAREGTPEAAVRSIKDASVRAVKKDGSGAFGVMLSLSERKVLLRRARSIVQFCLNLPGVQNQIARAHREALVDESQWLVDMAKAELARCQVIHVTRMNSLDLNTGGIFFNKLPLVK